ncbi:MAG TPA: multidrug effflux MFS transporter, partial [Armatimonadota bacterium]|nr:multidrug effflux MFS transporter [Armatimonadota bacterium]
MHDQSQSPPATEAPVPQRLRDFGLFALLALLSAFIPLSTDMYLPALPTMAANLGVPMARANLTLVLFFVFYSIGTLLWGPLSDKYGRKPILLIGLTGYVAACIACACATNITQLIIGRVLQALAGGASPAIAVALVKDLFQGPKRERGLVLIQSMVMLAPIIAPGIGALLLRVTTWHGIFWTLGGFGLVALLWSLRLRETVTEPFTGTLVQTWGQLGTVVKNRGFTLLLVTFSLAILPLYAYLASSSYIYITEFKQSELVFSAFFMANAACAVLAPFIYLRLTRAWSRRDIITACIAMLGISGVGIMGLGHLKPLALALCIMPATLAMGVIRPPSTHLMLEQHRTAAGAVSSLINFLMSMVGSLGMMLMSAGWRSLILPLGLVHLFAGVVCGGAWLLLARQPYIRHVPETRG